MKREFIKGLLPDITDEVLDKIMGENGKDVEGVKAKFADYDSMKTQLAEANTKLSGYDPEWKAKAEQAEKDAAAKIADMQFDGLLTGAVSAAKGKNAKAIRALLDVDALKASKNQEADIKTALEALAKDNGYLFDATETPPPYAPGTGNTPPAGNTKYTPEVNAIRAAAGLKTE
ncbi:Phage minor structural protein GP20 [anaerobic digester metagenome]